jgi:hypothetical protein
MNMKLRVSDICFDAGSVIDPSGIVFHYNDRIFRAIQKKYISDYMAILKSDFVKYFFDAGLIETWVSNLELEGFDLVLEHKKIPVLSCWNEWSPSMAKDATEMVCRLNIELFKRGYLTKDVQPGNIQFVNGKPYWIDFGSIIKSTNLDLFPIDAFRYHSVFPLWLFSKGKYELANAIYSEVGKGFLKTISTKKPFFWIPYNFTHIRKMFLKNKGVDSLEKLLSYVSDLSINPRKTLWLSYGQGGMPEVEDHSAFSQKALAVYSLLQRLKPGTLLDLAGNKGWYSELAASMGHQVISTDIDIFCVDYLYNKVKRKNISILPLVLDFLYPNPPYSIGLGKQGSFDRLRSDTTLVLALMHHLVFKQNLYFEPIARIVSNYTIKHSIIEFVPENDFYVRDWITSEHKWYSLDSFICTLKRYFSTVDVVPSWPEPRKLLFCTK